MIGVGPLIGITFMTYDFLNEHFNLGITPALQHLTFGALSGIAANFVAYPFDLIRK